MVRHHDHPSSPVRSLDFTAQDFHHHPKNQFWYMGMTILLVGVLAAAIWYHQYLLGAVVLAVGVAIFRLANLEPNARSIKLTSSGVYWGDKFFGYHQLRSFWLTEQAGRLTIYLERLNAAPAVSFVIPASSSQKATDFLGQFLPYRHRSEPLSDRFSRWLRL